MSTERPGNISHFLTYSSKNNYGNYNENIATWNQRLHAPTSSLITFCTLQLCINLCADERHSAHPSFTKVCFRSFRSLQKHRTRTGGADTLHASAVRQWTAHWSSTFRCFQWGFSLEVPREFLACLRVSLCVSARETRSGHTSSTNLCFHIWPSDVDTDINFKFSLYSPDLETLFFASFKRKKKK